MGIYLGTRKDIQELISKEGLLGWDIETKEDKEPVNGAEVERRGETRQESTNENTAAKK